MYTHTDMDVRQYIHMLVVGLCVRDSVCVCVSLCVCVCVSLALSLSLALFVSLLVSRYHLLSLCESGNTRVPFSPFLSCPLLSLPLSHLNTPCCSFQALQLEMVSVLEEFGGWAL